MDDKLREQVVDDLARGRERSDIVIGICDRTGLDWPGAERLVQQVEAEQAHEIAKRQLPIIAALSAVLALAGMFMLAFSIITISHLIGSNLALSLMMLATIYRFPVLIGILGILVLAGSAVGLHKILLRYFET